MKVPNVSAFSYFEVNGLFGENRNTGFEVFPIRFWEHIGVSIERFGHENKRFSFGVGLFSFFFDFPTKNEVK